MLEDYKAPGGNELYRSAVTDGQDIAQLGKLIKQRKASRGHYLRVRMKNGHPYELGMDSSEEADALLAWLLAKAPHAQPYA